MTRQTIIPANEAEWLELRANDITSTDCAALFGLSPYKTYFELWHEKRAGEVVRIEDNARMEWGRLFEPVVAGKLSRDNGWHIRHMSEYMRLPEHRIGASYDYRIVNGTNDSENDVVLEIKCVDYFAFQKKWIVESDYIEAPPHIEIQVQHQMLVSGLQSAYIAVMIGGNDVRLIHRVADKQVHAGIIAKCREFWQSIDRNEPPPPVMPDDADALISLYQYAAPGKLLDGRKDALLQSMVAEYNALGGEEKTAAENRKVAKARLLEYIGEHEKVLLDGYSFSAGIVAPSEGTLVTQDMVGQRVGGRAGYRMLRVTKKTPKMTGNPVNQTDEE